MNKNNFLTRIKNIIDKVCTISFKDNILYIIVRHIIIVFKVITSTKSNNKLRTDKACSNRTHIF